MVDVENGSGGFMRTRVPRLAAVWLVLGAAAGLVGGCAGNTASASGDASEHAEARVFASEVNLRASDIPGFKPLVSLGEGTATPLDRRIEECDGGPILNKASFDVASALFQTQTGSVQTVVSTVTLMRGPSTASGYIAAAVSRRGLGCIQRDERRKSVTRWEVEVYAPRFSVGGATVSGVRLASCLPAFHDCNTRRVRGFRDRLWFAVGRYVVMLGFVAGPSNGATAQQSLLPVERHLLAVLYSRAQVHRP